MARHRNPYLAQLRGFGGSDEWNKGRRFGGVDTVKGCEALIATEQGAVVARVARIRGVERVRVHLKPWKDFKGEMQGQEVLLYDGPIDEERGILALEDGEHLWRSDLHE